MPTSWGLQGKGWTGDRECQARKLAGVHSRKSKKVSGVWGEHRCVWKALGPAGPAWRGPETPAWPEALPCGSFKAVHSGGSVIDKQSSALCSL